MLYLSPNTCDQFTPQPSQPPTWIYPIQMMQFVADICYIFCGHFKYWDRSRGVSNEKFIRRPDIQGRNSTKITNPRPERSRSLRRFSHAVTGAVYGVCSFLQSSLQLIQPTTSYFPTPPLEMRTSTLISVFVLRQKNSVFFYTQSPHPPYKIRHIVRQIHFALDTRNH